MRYILKILFLFFIASGYSQNATNFTINHNVLKITNRTDSIFYILECFAWTYSVLVNLSKFSNYILKPVSSIYVKNIN